MATRSLRFAPALFVLFIAHSSVRAQSQTDSVARGAVPLAAHRSAWQTIGDDINTSISDAGMVFTAPARFDTEHWIDFSSVLLGTAMVMTQDSSGRRWVKETKQSATPANPHTELDNLTTLGNFYGNAAVGVAIAAGVYAGGLAAGSDNVRVTGRMVFESLLFAGATTTVLKVLIGRGRPYTDQGPYAFHGLQFGADNNSLPSGHTTVAFAVSSVLAARINKPIASVLLYGLAAVTAGARIYSDNHWMSDTFVAAAIGTSIGYGVAHLHDDDGAQHTWRVVPTLSGIAVVAQL